MYNRDVILLLVSRILRSVAAGVLSVVVGLYYLKGLHLSLLSIGVLFGVGAFVTPVLSLFLGMFSDRIGRKKVLLLTLFFLPLAVLILLVTSWFPLLLLSSALGGFGIAGGLIGGGVGASVAPMQTALLAEKVRPEERTKVFSLFTTLSSYAGAGGALLSHITHYRELFFICLIISLGSTFVVLPIREEFRPKKVKVQAGRSDDEIIKKFTVTGVLNGVSQGLIVPFIPIIFSREYGLSQGSIGDVISLGGVISATVMLTTPWLVTKMGFVRLIIVTRSASALMVLLFPFLWSPLLASLDYLAFTPLRIVSLPAQQALMMNLVGEGRRATATGANQAGRLLPSAASTTFSGFLLNAMSIAVPFEISCVATLVNSLLYFKFFRNVDRMGSGSVTVME